MWKLFMRRFYHTTQNIMLALLLCFASSLAHAKLPPSINGQALPSLADMLEHVTPAVVNISASGRQVLYDPAISDPIYQHFFSNRLREQTTRGTGSGIIVDAKKGYIITNSHVIEGADKITITLNDNRQFQGHLVGQDPQADIAVIQIQANLMTLDSEGNTHQQPLPKVQTVQPSRVKVEMSQQEQNPLSVPTNQEHSPQ